MVDDQFLALLPERGSYCENNMCSLGQSAVRPHSAVFFRNKKYLLHSLPGSVTCDIQTQNQPVLKVTVDENG